MELLLEMGPSNKRLDPCARINAVLRGLLLISLSFLFQKDEARISNSLMLPVSLHEYSPSLLHALPPDAFCHGVL